MLPILQTLARLAVELVASFFIADFLSGLVHWFEDAYFNRDMHPWLVKNVTEPNRLHHIYPRLTAHTSAWLSFVQIIIPGSIICLPFLIPALGVQPMYVFVLGFGILSNYVHKWNHQKKIERPKYFELFQKLRILQPVIVHSVHHTGDSDKGYCTLSPFLNVVLDRINFWRGVEAAIFFVTKVRANGPDEPLKYYKMENGQVMQFEVEGQQWSVWPHKAEFDLPVRRALSPYCLVSL
jgi:hypothetical protein